MAVLPEAWVRSARRSFARKSAAYVVKNYRFLATDPSFFWMKTIARFEVARAWSTRPQAKDSPVDAASPLFDAAHDFASVLETLRREGYYVGLSLAPDVLAELQECMQATVCYGDRDPHLGFYIGQRDAFERDLGRKLKVATYFNQQLNWPVFARLKRDPWLNAIARAYLGREPVYLRSEVAWSFASASTPEERAAAAQVLHCDINGFKTLKLFFYLNDVDAKNGPHAYIKKSSRRRTLKHQLLGQRCSDVPDDTLLRTYGAEHLVVVCGPAGTGFVGDPYYFHRGTEPTEGCRALLQIELGCRAYRTWYFDV
jgi:hypothetical protein